MPDPIFDNPKLAAIYDAFDGPRNDLSYYLAIANELKAKSVLDVGCGTGCFSCLLSQHGFDVTGIDPAQASLDIARRKPHADNVKWVLGDALNLPSLSADLAVMTGNVAQVFLTDDDWVATLKSIHHTLKPAGYLVFEVRDPAQQAWLKWTKEKTYSRLDVPGAGIVESWCDVTEASGELISFRWTYNFKSDESSIISDSTLRFRSRNTIENSLIQAGYDINDVRGAPDRPKQEFVFIAQRA